MTLASEQLYHAANFQAERKGMAELNTIAHCLFRALLEVQEAESALYDPEQTTDDLIDELIDVQMFIASALKAVCDTEGLPYEEIDNRYAAKGRKNERRYDPDHFALVGQVIGGKEFTTQDAVARSRHHAKNGFTPGSDTY